MNMSDKKYRSFPEFWPFYVSEHLDPNNRKLHFVGTTLAVINLIKFLTTLKKRFLLFGVISGYFFAWIGHFIVEKNRPATFQYPGKSLIADFKMYGLMWTNKMDREVEKVIEKEISK